MYLGVAENLAYCLITLLMDSKKSFSLTVYVVGEGKGCELSPAGRNKKDIVRKSQHLLAGSYGKHACFCTHTANISASGIGAQTSEQFKTDVPLTAHLLRMNLEDRGSSL